MKKLLLLCLLAPFWFNGISQNLTNTTWEVRDSTNSLNGYYRFEIDTIHWSNDNITYSPISLYQTNTNIFKIVEYIGLACPFDTGYYNYNILNDTLDFTLINDTCISRGYVFDTFNWVRLPTNISSFESEPFLWCYPNPFDQFIYLKLKEFLVGTPFTIYDNHGKVAVTGTVVKVDNIINVQQLSPGIYFLTLHSIPKLTYKLIKQ
jgi:type IX secretion system substrate protein